MNRSLPIPVALVIALIACTPLLAQDKPEQVLESKGLKKVGLLWVLEGEQKVQEHLRQLRAFKPALTAEARKRENAEARIKHVKRLMAEMNAEYGDLNAEMATVASNNRARQVVSRINVLVAQLNEGNRQLELLDEELRKLPDSRDKNVTLTVQAAKEAEMVALEYETLAKDEAVKNALIQLNDTSKIKTRLGPSPGFTQDLNVIRRERQGVSVDTVKVSWSTNVPVVNITINETLTMPIMLDSGASIVVLNAETADKLGLKPGPNDPTIKSRIADGSIVEGKLMTLKSIQLGQFIVENVECEVMPASMKTAPNLLGGSFLRNFVYKLNPGASELHLTQISGAPKNKSTTTPPVQPATRANQKPDAQPEASAAPPSLPAGNAPDAKPLFDGKTLTGWNGDIQFWNVAGGAIVGSAGGKTDTHLFARNSYKNFRLDLEFRLVEGNTGVRFRAQPDKDHAASAGYEADLFYPNGVGKLAFNDRIVFRPERAAQDATYKHGEWNRFALEANGPHIRIWINDQLLTDLKHQGPVSGALGLQIYGKTEAYFRNIQIRELP